MSGRHFLQIPGPTNVPERILRAMDRAVIDHRGPELPAVVEEVRSGLKQVFQTTEEESVLYPGSGTGAWEASIVNVLSPGDRVLAFDIGHFSHLYAQRARRFGVVVDEVELPWGEDVPPDVVYDRLFRDAAHRYRAVLVVHNETSTGVTSDLAAIREAMDAARHPALLLVDVVSALGSIEVRFDQWRMDVALTGTQKGLMMPPGMAVLCASPRALDESRRATAPRYFFDWGPVLEEMRRGYFPYTPATLAVFGLREAVRMLLEEGLPQVFARHRRLAEGVRRAVTAWGMRILCGKPERRSNSLTAVVTPEGGRGRHHPRGGPPPALPGDGSGPAQGDGLPHRPPGRAERAGGAGHDRGRRARLPPDRASGAAGVGRGRGRAVVRRGGERVRRARHGDRGLRARAVQPQGPARGRLEDLASRETPSG